MVVNRTLLNLQAPGDGDGLVDEWLGLMDRTPASSFFTTPDWVLSWWDTFGVGRVGLLGTWRNEGSELLAIVPMIEHRERFHSRIPLHGTTWTMLGGGFGSADHLRFTLQPGAVGAVMDWLHELRSDHSLLLPNFDSEAMPAIAYLSGGVTLRRTVCPRLDLSLNDIGSPDFRKKQMYYRRRIEKEGVQFEWVSPGSIDDEILGALFDLHEDRWEDKTGARPAHLRSRAAFFRELVRRGDAARGPCGIVARHNDDIVGVLFGFWYRDTFSYFQTGWSPDWKRYSLGTVLVSAAIAAARERGAAVFDFLRGTDEYKYRFGAVDRIDETVLYPTGLTGALLRWKYTSGRVVAARLRR